MPAMNITGTASASAIAVSTGFYSTACQPFQQLERVIGSKGGVALSQCQKGPRLSSFRAYRGHTAVRYGSIAVDASELPHALLLKVIIKA
jgi:hypothetical protein